MKYRVGMIVVAMGLLLGCGGKDQPVATSSGAQVAGAECTSSESCKGGTECAEVPDYAAGKASKVCLYPCTSHGDCETRDPSLGCSRIGHCVVKGTLP